MPRHSYRSLRPRLDVLEPRDLPSGIIASHAGHAHVLNLSGSSSQSVVQPAAGNTPPASPLLGRGQPTPHEVARERFVAQFTGPFTTAPGRFSDQAQMVFIRGVGGSNFFLHGNMSFGVAVEKDPTNTSFGFLLMNDKNVNSGGTLGLDLTVTPDGFDGFGRPTKMTFTQDANIYSGTFFVNTSSGTVTVKYQPSTGGPRAPGATSQGIAKVTIHGMVYTSGLTSPLRNTDLSARGPRTSPHSGHLF
jgi:hypothetical protein